MIEGLAEHGGLSHFKVYSMLSLLGAVLTLCSRNQYSVGSV